MRDFASKHGCTAPQPRTCYVTAPSLTHQLLIVQIGCLNPNPSFPTGALTLSAVSSARGTLAPDHAALGC